MKYLKLFSTDSEYQRFAEEEMILPNVSYVEDVDIVYYNPGVSVALLPLKFKAHYDDYMEDYDMMANHKDESNKDYNVAIYNTILSLINEGSAIGLYAGQVSLYIERDEVTEDISEGYDYVDPNGN